MLRRCLEQQFGGALSETQTLRGLWRRRDDSYRDDLIRVFVGWLPLSGA